MKRPRIAVLQIEGTNCERESATYFRALGAEAEEVHLKQFTDPDLHPSLRRDLFDYGLLMVPGGFSGGDYVRAGAILAARLKSALGKDLVKYVEEGHLLFGVCNGFQVLIEAGLLPGLPTPMSAKPQAVLATNDSSHYECRPTLLQYGGGPCQFTRKLAKGQILQIPSAHGEGKLLFPPEEQEDWLRRLEENGQIVFRYVDDRGKEGGFPWNPNGTPGGIAALCNPQGNVLGIMPHPERSFYRYLHPDWTRRSGPEGFGDGAVLFQSALESLGFQG